MKSKTTECVVKKIKSKQSGRRTALLRRELKLLASTLSRVLCYYESNSTIVVTACSRGGVGAREGTGRLRALVCNARVHWNQRERVAMENSPERGYTPSVDTGRRGAN